MTPEDRAQLSSAWLEAGLGEHASVAAFARFTLHLLSLGAPPQLLRDAIKAMDDEVRHALLCFGIARRFSGQALGPGPMDLSRVFEQSDEPSAILKAAIVEGCIEETISARGAHLASELAEDSAIRAALHGLATDEARHAELSWGLVEWMLSVYPALAPEAERCFARALAEEHGACDAADTQEVRWMEKYGQLAPSTKQRLREQVIRDEIVRRVEALFGHPSGAATSSSGVAAEPLAG